LLKNLNITTFNNAIVLVLLGFAALLLVHNSNITNALKSAINIVVELNEEVKIAEIDDFKQQLKNNYKINPSTVEYIPKKEAKIRMNDILDDQLYLSDEVNPFRDAVIFSLNDEEYKDEYLEELSEQLTSIPFVSKVYYQKEFFDIVQSNVMSATKFSIILALLFLLITISLIYNGIRLTLSQDKQKIDTMALVGAKPSYVKRPYYRDAFLQGAISTVLALILLSIITLLIAKQLPEASNIIQASKVLLIYLLIFMTGITIFLGATRLVLNRFFDQMYL